MNAGRKIMLLVVGVGILSVAGFGAISVAHSAGQCGIGGAGVKEDNDPDCCSVGEGHGNESGSEKSVAAAEIRKAGNPKNAENEGPVNVKCPLMGSEIDEEKLTEELLVEHKGHTVGICCDKCLGPWDELSDEEKDEKLRESL